MSDTELYWIPGFENKYLINKSGTIISLMKKNYKVMKVTAKRGGYLHLGLLVRSPKKYYYVDLHWLLAYCFVPGYKTGLYACHKDGNRNNNYIDNLYWGTPKQNTQDSIAHSTRAGSGWKKLTKQSISLAMEYKASGLSYKEIAILLNTTERTISRNLSNV